MKRLVNVNREGGYPLTGEALEILAKDMPEYINAILDDIVPENSIVFLNDRYAYYKSRQNQVNAHSEIMEYTIVGDIEKSAILQGAHFNFRVVNASYGDTVSGIAYDTTREDVAFEITEPINGINHPSAYSLRSLIKELTKTQARDYTEDIIISIDYGTGVVRNANVEGYAIVKDGIAEIQLRISTPNTGALDTNCVIEIQLPDALECPISISSNCVQANPNDTDFAEIHRCTALLYGNKIRITGGWVNSWTFTDIYFSYRPIPEPVAL